MFGISLDKIIVIAIIAAVVIGPQRLPTYAAKLADLVKSARRLLATAGDRVKGELGPDAEDIDWKKLDPRQYDPRRIVRQALLDDEPFMPVVPVMGRRGERAPLPGDDE